MAEHLQGAAPQALQLCQYVGNLTVLVGRWEMANRVEIKRIVDQTLGSWSEYNSLSNGRATDFRIKR
jgi:hypothetical protein